MLEIARREPKILLPDLQRAVQLSEFEFNNLRGVFIVVQYGLHAHPPRLLEPPVGACVRFQPKEEFLIIILYIDNNFLMR